MRLAAAALLAASAAAAGEFVDPLDRPAQGSPLAQRRPLVGVAAAGGRLVAVGQRGHVLVSDDGGRSWAPSPAPVSTDLNAVAFPSPDRGWAVGHDGVVLATADAGRSWSKQLDGRQVGALLLGHHAGRGGADGTLRQVRALAAQGADQPLLDVWFEDERTGFAVGAFNLVLRTEDGGRSWAPWLHRTENPRGLHLYAIRRVAGDLWIAGEQGLVLRLDAAGRRFRAVPVPYRGSFFGVAGSGRTVIAYGLRGTALRSRDRGATWQRVDTGVEVALTGAASMPDGRIALVAQSGQVLVSSDDGESFQPAGRGGSPASSAAAAGAGTLVIVGAAGVRVEPLRP
ncbi:MAG TPA: YCF48-related protein [Anaeromyxobacteraceae bacterium]|jgi:photosystem II stability/assembly factor-like uncharacterized protein